MGNIGDILNYEYKEEAKVLKEAIKHSLKKAGLDDWAKNNIEFYGIMGPVAYDDNYIYDETYALFTNESPLHNSFYSSYYYNNYYGFLIYTNALKPTSPLKECISNEQIEEVSKYFKEYIDIYRKNRNNQQVKKETDNDLSV